LAGTYGRYVHLWPMSANDPKRTSLSLNAILMKAGLKSMNVENIDHRAFRCSGIGTFGSRFCLIFALNEASLVITSFRESCLSAMGQ